MPWKGTAPHSKPDDRPINELIWLTFFRAAGYSLAEPVIKRHLSLCVFDSRPAQVIHLSVSRIVGLRNGHTRFPLLRARPPVPKPACRLPKVTLSRWASHSGQRCWTVVRVAVPGGVWSPTASRRGPDWQPSLLSILS